MTAIQYFFKTFFLTELLKGLALTFPRSARTAPV
jgi:hypothetical protein